MKRIFTKTGKELRKEFMGKATCNVTIHCVENAPTDADSVFGVFTAATRYGITRVAKRGSAEGKGTITPGFWIFEEPIEFEAPLQVSKEGVLLPIKFSLNLHCREHKNAITTKDLGVVDVDLAQVTTLDSDAATDFFPVGSASANGSMPFIRISCAFHFHSEDVKKNEGKGAAAAAAASDVPKPGEWNLNSLLASAKSVFQDINSNIDDDSAKTLVAKGQDVLDKVTSDEETRQLLTKNLAIIEHEIDEFAKTATGQEVKALVDHYAKKEETQKVLDGAEKLLEEVKTKPESQALVEKAQKLIAKLEEDEISRKLQQQWRETVDELTDDQRRELLVKRVGSEEQRAAIASELHTTLTSFLASDNGKQVVSEGEELLRSGQKFLEDLTQQDGVKGLISTLDSLIDDFEANEHNIGAPYLKEGRRLVTGFVEDEKGKEAIAKGEELLTKISQKQVDVHKILLSVVEQASDSADKSNLPPDVKEVFDLLDTIKDAVTGYLVKHLPEVDVPAVQGHTSDTPIGNIDYMIHSIAFSDLNLPESQVDVTIDPNEGISVTASNIQVSVRDFTWCYRQSAWPHMTGVGLGLACVKGASVNVCLDFTLGTDNVTFVLKQNSIEITDLQIEAVGNKTPWLYNFLLYAFKGT